MIQLDALDSIFLSIATPETPAQIGGLAILDPSTTERFDFERFRDFVAERVALCPRFSWRVHEVPLGLDDPYWVDFPEFDIRDHVHRAALPEPGGQQELAELAGRLFASPLSTDRPLWEMFLVEGLQGGRVSLLWKLNHCLMDGVSGAGLVELLFDMEPEPAERPAPPESEPRRAGRPPSLFEMAANGTRNAVRRNLSIARSLGQVASSSLAALPRMSPLAGLPGLGSRPEPAEPAPAVPRASFNGVVGGRRSVAWTSVSLADVKEQKERFDVTVNDVILAISGGAVRKYLEERGELPDESLYALMPVSTREQGDASVGNQVREVAVRWGTEVENPVERLQAISASTSEAKQGAKDGLNLMSVLAESLPPLVTGLVTRAGAAFPDQVPLPGNAVVSNVRMTPFPLFIAGARIVNMVPMSVLAPTQGLNITAVSYCGEVHIGITADPSRVAEPARIADAIPKALGELQQAAEDYVTILA